MKVPLTVHLNARIVSDAELNIASVSFRACVLFTHPRKLCRIDSGDIGSNTHQFIVVYSLL